MYDSLKTQCETITDSFLQTRMAVTNTKYDEILLRNILLSMRWKYIDEDIRLRYVIDNINHIKSEVELRSKIQNIDIKFLCETGYSLYCINRKTQNLNKFISSYNKLIFNWTNRYIQQLQRITGNDHINLSYDSGLCHIICYMLLYSCYFSEQLNLLIKQLIQKIPIDLSDSDINFGMRYGIGGYLYTLNSVKERFPENKEVDKAINYLFNIYLQNIDISDEFYQWPAIRKHNGELVNNIADTWSYGPSMILYNLLNTNISQNNYNLEKEIKIRSYLPAGDLYLNDVGFYSGYAGILNVFCLCSKKYYEKSFEEKKKDLLEKILKGEQKEGIFQFYKFENRNGHLEKVIDGNKNQIIESYMVYIVLSKVFEK